MTFSLQQDMNNRLVGPSRESCSQSWQWETKLQRLEAQRDPGGQAPSSTGFQKSWFSEALVTLEPCLLQRLCFAVLLIGPLP